MHLGTWAGEGPKGCWRNKRKPAISLVILKLSFLIFQKTFEFYRIVRENLSKILEIYISMGSRAEPQNLANLKKI